MGDLLTNNDRGAAERSIDPAKVAFAQHISSDPQAGVKEELLSNFLPRHGNQIQFRCTCPLVDQESRAIKSVQTMRLRKSRDQRGWQVKPKKTGQILMETSRSTGLTRRALLGAFAATTVAAAPTYANAFGFLRGAGDVRRIKMYNGRTGESMNTVYWVDGNYLKDALTEVNHFMRDWRNGQIKAIDTRTLDIMAASHRLMDTSEAYTLISGYRSPETNNMLRSRSSGVAKNSRHLVGEAADLRMNSRSVAQISRAASACAAGGVGRYSSSNFVHMDCGPVRSWGR